MQSIGKADKEVMMRPSPRRASQARRLPPRVFIVMGVAALLLLTLQVFLVAGVLNSRELSLFEHAGRPLDDENRSLLRNSGTSSDNDIRSGEHETSEKEPVKKEKVNPADEFRLAKLLHDAGLTSVESDKLPRWKDVEGLYGSEPVIFGTDTCEAFRLAIPRTERWLAVAGMFNTGTNLLSDYMTNSCTLPGKHRRTRSNLWQVEWGKHSLANRRLKHTKESYQQYNKTATIPVVIIRDPYNWMQSMCKHPYSTRWEHRGRCPNLISNELDKGVHEKGVPIPATIKYLKNYTEYFPSLAHVWNEYYSQYRNADYPRLMIRYEDMLFYPKAVMKRVCECVDGDFLDSGFSLKVDNAKFGPGHGEQNPNHGLLTSILKNTDLSRRVKDFSEEDLIFARDSALDADLMELFRYSHPTLDATSTM